MDKLTIISGCLFLAADIFAIASIANPDWINTGESAGALTVGLVRQCQTIHGRDRTCIPPRLPPEWVTTLFFIIMGIISLTVTCGLLVASHWRREATKYARWIAFTGRGDNNGMTFSSTFKCAASQPHFHSQTYDRPRLNFKKRFLMRPMRL
ncbi:modulator of smoothened protein isoform X3 [Suricata suricatta]|uniref:modulator of smoothened protein isoform X3 n=1 Tax=Suricata suricatta TaxID=37032 RepID=UPI001155A851|nr:modulator of smoothened protein isoform X3 [Suricata suricatta]